MNKIDLFNFLRNTSVSIPTAEIVSNLLVTLLIALFIYWVYLQTYYGVVYNRSFNLTIVLISMVTAMVMMVIKTNLALSLGMVGALSIIRFRSAIKDPKDIGFLFWGVAVGLSAGTGAYMVAVVGSLVIAMILFVFNVKMFEDATYLLVIKGQEINEQKLEHNIGNHVVKFKLRMKNSNGREKEIIYEVKIKDKQEDQLIKQIIDDDQRISSVNMVSHKGDIPG